MNRPTAPQSISLLLKPASGCCNLSCAYCFYRRVLALYPGPAARMSRGTAETVIRKTLSAGAAFNSFCWQGGEPLLMGLDFFREAVKFQRRYARPGQSIENSIQTNGLLIDDAWCEFLRNERFLVGVSLDGPAPIHDFYRKDPAGEGTFAHVIKSIGLMQQHAVSFNILCLLTDQNVASPLELYRFFRSQRFDFLQFIPCFAKEEPVGGPKSSSVRGEEVGDFYVTLFDEWYKRDFDQVSIRFFEDLLLYLVDGVKASCCFQSACDGYLVVEHNGDCYPCDFFVYREWKLGNLVAGDLGGILDHPLRARFASRKAALPGRCRECRIVRFCMGDCIRFRERPAGRRGPVSEYCQAIRKIYRHLEPLLPEIAKRVADYRRSAGKDAGDHDLIADGAADRP